MSLAKVLGTAVGTAICGVLLGAALAGPAHADTVQTIALPESGWGDTGGKVFVIEDPRHLNVCYVAKYDGRVAISCVSR